MSPETLTVVYRDEHLIAIDKPSALLVHRSGIDRHETRFAMQILRDQIGQRVYPLHRLDKPTSGVLLFALDADTARRAGPLFEDHCIRKRYLAVVRSFWIAGSLMRRWRWPMRGVAMAALRWRGACAVTGRCF